jgi:intracellular septation protein A
MGSHRMGKFYFGLDLLINLGGPWLVYSLVEGSVSTTVALLLSSLPPIIWSLVQLVHSRKVDVISLLVIAGIAASLVATLLGGNPRLLLVRESFITGIFGLVFLGSLWFPRPLMFYIVKATVAKQGIAEAQFAGRWSIPGFRQTFYLMTAVWGIGLIAQAVMQVILAFALSIEQDLVISPIVGYGFYLILFGWSFWYGKRRREKGERLAARAAQESTGDGAI